LSPLLTVRDVARALSVSECWVRRHSRELGLIRLGRLMRFDPCTFPYTRSIVAGAEVSPEPERHSMPRLRRYQRGSLHKKKGRWYGSFRTNAIGPTGEVVRKQRHILVGSIEQFPTKYAAQEELRRIMNEVPSEPAQTVKFSEVVERWKATQVPAMKASSARHYLNTLKTVAPAFDSLDVATITRFMVDQFIQEKSGAYSRSTLCSVKTTLSIVLGYALANEWVERNVVIGVKVPRAENCGGSPITRCQLTPGQVWQLVEGLSEPYSTLVAFLSATGLRIGEAAGLRLSDITDRGLLHVRRRIYDGKSDDLKTKGSNRRLPLPEELVSRLGSLRMNDEVDSFIFKARNGSPLNPGNWLRREIHPVASKLGINLSGWHDFRHFFTVNSGAAGRTRRSCPACSAMRG